MKYPGTVRYLGKDRQRYMLRNGYCIELSENFTEECDADALYSRLSESYENVKIYYDTTMIRGLHKNYAMCKGRKAKAPSVTVKLSDNMSARKEAETSCR